MFTRRAPMRIETTCAGTKSSTGQGHGLHRFCTVGLPRLIRSTCMSMWFVLVLVATCNLSACSTAWAVAQPPRSEVVGDTSQFAALVGWAARLEGDTDTRIDPRPMPAQVDTFDVEPPPIAPVEAAVVQERSRVLARMGIGETDAVEDSRCMWSRGLAPPPLPGSPPATDTISERCRAMDHYRAVIFSLPRPQDERSRKVIRVAVFLNYGFDVYDVVVDRARVGGWQVIHAEPIAGAKS